MLRRGKQWLIMDNASWHHAHDNAIEGIARLYGVTIIWLAPYHPQANPCENLFGNVKCMLKDYRDELELLRPAPRARLLLRIFKESANEGKCTRWVGKCGYFANLG